MADVVQPGSNHLNFVGSNTLTQVMSKSTVIWSIHIENNSGSSGYLQIYDKGTGAITAGTNMYAAYGVSSGTIGAGTPSTFDKTFAPNGLALNGGLSYLWSAGTTGTVQANGNALIDIVYEP